MPNSIARETVVTSTPLQQSSQIVRLLSFPVYFILLCTSSNFNIKGKLRELLAKKVGKKSPDSMIVRTKSVQQHTALNKLNFPALYQCTSSTIKSPMPPKSPCNTHYRTKKNLDREMRHTAATKNLRTSTGGKYDADAIWLKIPLLPIWANLHIFITISLPQCTDSKPWEKGSCFHLPPKFEIRKLRPCLSLAPFIADLTNHVICHGTQRLTSQVLKNTSK